MQNIFITGGSGYIGTSLLKSVDLNAFHVTALVRPGSEDKIPPGIEINLGNIFEPEQWESRVPNNCIFIHLLGVSHPSPAKAKLFEDIDLRSVEICSEIAKQHAAVKFIYLSVCMEPAAFMKSFQSAKQRGEEIIRSKVLSSIMFRPWYVLGKNHWWPYLFFPLFWLLRILPWTSKKAKAFGFVTIKEMTHSLLFVLENYSAIEGNMETIDIRTTAKAWKNINRTSTQKQF
jgi:hypothetical protein